MIISSTKENLEQNSMLCTHQHGFMKNRYNIMQLQELKEELTEKMEGGRQTDIFIMNCVKAIDKVNHSFLPHNSITMVSGGSQQV